MKNGDNMSIKNDIFWYFLLSFDAYKKMHYLGPTY